LANFRAGVNSIRVELELKFASFDSCPLRLAGLASRIHSESVKTAQEVLRWFDSLVRTDNEHNMTLRFLMRGSPLRVELEAFANGTILDMLPLLKIAVNKMRTMSIVERSIEAKHALAKSKLLGASRPSPPLVSFSLRGPEMRELLAEDVDGSFAKQLAVDFAACRGSQALVGSMGLQGHNAVNEDFHLQGL
jgi:hypothetical protein